MTSVEMQVYRRRAVPLSWGPAFQDAVEFVGASPNQSSMIVWQDSLSSGSRNEGIKDSSFVSPCDHCSTQVLILTVHVFSLCQSPKGS
jgi:hypothetical protein